VVGVLPREIGDPQEREHRAAVGRVAVFTQRGGPEAVATLRLQHRVPDVEGETRRLVGEAERDGVEGAERLGVESAAEAVVLADAQRVCKGEEPACGPPAPSRVAEGRIGRDVVDDPCHGGLPHRVPGRRPGETPGRERRGRHVRVAEPAIGRRVCAEKQAHGGQSIHPVLDDRARAEEPADGRVGGPDICTRSRRAPRRVRGDALLRRQRLPAVGEGDHRRDRPPDLVGTRREQIQAQRLDIGGGRPHRDQRGRVHERRIARDERGDEAQDEPSVLRGRVREPAQPGRVPEAVRRQQKRQDRHGVVASRDAGLTDLRSAGDQARAVLLAAPGVESALDGVGNRAREGRGRAVLRGGETRGREQEGEQCANRVRHAPVEARSTPRVTSPRAEA
jgi:hypothetical protein